MGRVSFEYEGRKYAADYRIYTVTDGKTERRVHHLKMGGLEIEASTELMALSLMFEAVKKKRR